jgi:hypothetical protein
LFPLILYCFRFLWTVSTSSVLLSLGWCCFMLFHLGLCCSRLFSCWSPWLCAAPPPTVCLLHSKVGWPALLQGVLTQVHWPGIFAHTVLFFNTAEESIGRAGSSRVPYSTNR